MRLQQLHLLHFRNHASLDLAFGNQINCLLGPNGSGKTNVLDAIFYLCQTKSYLHPNDSLIIAHGEEEMHLSAQFLRHEQRDHVSCGVRKGVKKVFKLNEKVYDRMADHIGRFPAVMIAPDDAALIHEGSEMRRKWIDSVISMFDRRYLDDLMDYNRCLSQRNALLRYFAENRTWDEAMLEPWDDRMAGLAAEIRKKRSAFVADFRPRFQAIHADLAQGAEEVSLSDVSQLTADERDIRGSFVEARAEDRRLRRSTKGIHKDDVAFLLSGRLLRRFGSQGQQKTFLLALRLAQLEYLESATGVKPILLLDDIFDKIDEHRARALMERLSGGAFGQVFLTDTSLTRMPEWLEATGADVQVYACVAGEVTAVSGGASD